MDFSLRVDLYHCVASQRRFYFRESRELLSSQKFLNLCASCDTLLDYIYLYISFIILSSSTLFRHDKARNFMKRVTLTEFQGSQVFKLWTRFFFILFFK